MKYLMVINIKPVDNLSQIKTLEYIKTFWNWKKYI